MRFESDSDTPIVRDCGLRIADSDCRDSDCECRNPTIRSPQSAIAYARCA